MEAPLHITGGGGIARLKYFVERPAHNYVSGEESSMIYPALIQLLNMCGNAVGPLGQPFWSL